MLWKGQWYGIVGDSEAKIAQRHDFLIIFSGQLLHSWHLSTTLLIGIFSRWNGCFPHWLLLVVPLSPPTKCRLNHNTHTHTCIPFHLKLRPLVLSDTKRLPHSRRGLGHGCIFFTQTHHVCTTFPSISMPMSELGFPMSSSIWTSLS